MPLYYVTGMAGTGKSTVLQELKHRGYEAHDTDEKDFAGYYNTKTNERETRNLSAHERTPEWRKDHIWKLPREKVLQLKERSGSRAVFLCGVTSNDADDFWKDMDQIFALCAPPEVIKHRVLTRTGASNYGKNPHEFEQIMKEAENSVQEYRSLGAVIIDATKPSNLVVDEIISYVENGPSKNN